MIRYLKPITGATAREIDQIATRGEASIDSYHWSKYSALTDPSGSMLRRSTAAARDPSTGTLQGRSSGATTFEEWICLGA